MGKNKMCIFSCKSTTLGCVLDEILNVVIEYDNINIIGRMWIEKYILNFYKQMWKNITFVEHSFKVPVKCK